MINLFQLTILLLVAAMPLSANERQGNGYCKQDGSAEQDENCEQSPPPSCCKKKKGHRWGDDSYWRNDRFAEEQFHETGWPGRRGDELSDQLSR